MDAAENDPEFRNLLKWLTKHTGIKFREDQLRYTMATLQQLMKRAGVGRYAEFRLTLAKRPPLLSDCIDQLTVGETYFFREPQHFEFIRHTVLPELRLRRGPLEPIRAWSAGCASGEEAYSLAIVFTQEHVSSASTILATDLSNTALEKARRAEFRPWSFRGEASDVVRSFASVSGDRYTLNERIKRRVRFHRLNLAVNTYPSPASGTCDMDLILCRNVLIYFGSETVGEISRRLYQCLAPGGWLITASGDPQLAGHAEFEVVSSDLGVFYRRRLEVPRQSSQPAGDTFRVQRPGDATTGESNVTSNRPETASQQKALAVTSTPSRSRGVFAKRAPGEVTPTTPAGKIAAAVAALDAGDFARADRLTEDLVDHSEACLVRIKAVAAIDPRRATEICRMATVRHPLVEELHYLYGVLLSDADQPLMALESIRKAIFLNRSSVMSHFLFASIQLRRGQYDSARKHFRRVCELCALGDADDVLPLSNGETVSEIAVAAQSQLSRIELRRDS
ncbi:Chemotaxis protein methyltransferase Cher2 [Stieleria maiorica]|uniref:Chemotaxis protein methyltransferase Cher2 n=1 Tax=Stieleria maiorica TaxID=2795974 RepID=A0A5B9MF49_9BACT|nr:CheR family methyltransferase [Stieleria maiorica]QEF98620.1 Chemotaxis protein methyltransferase Cher2 [Stieleria maiorica]